MSPCQKAGQRHFNLTRLAQNGPADLIDYGFQLRLYGHISIHLFNNGFAKAPMSWLRLNDRLSGNISAVIRIIQPVSGLAPLLGVSVVFRQPAAAGPQKNNRPRFNTFLLKIQQALTKIGERGLDVDDRNAF
jgi:hypothetical protein